MTKQLKQQNSAGIQLANVSQKSVSLYNAYLTSKKLKDFSTKEDLLVMNSFIIRWAKYIGVSMPEPSDLNMLANFIKENFPSLNSQDIEECINLVATDKLNTDAEPYGKLSPIYVSKVLKAYQIYRSEIFSEIRIKLEKEKQMNAPKLTKEERVNSFKLLLKNAKESIDNQQPFHDFGEIIYCFIKKNELVYMPELVDNAMKYGGEKFVKKAQDNSLKAVINNVDFTKLKKEDLIKQYAREYVTIHWLKITDVKAFANNITFEMLE